MGERERERDVFGFRVRARTLRKNEPCGEPKWYIKIDAAYLLLLLIDIDLFFSGGGTRNRK